MKIISLFKTFSILHSVILNLVSTSAKRILDCQTGKRLLKNGSKMKPGTVNNYRSLQKLLLDFVAKNRITLRIKNLNNCTSRQFLIERNYWKKVYRGLTNYMYKTKNNHDNYVGTNLKLIRSFFNYLNTEKGIETKLILPDFRGNSGDRIKC